MIMGLATLVGFDAAANLAEEAKDPFRTVPRAIVGSVVAAAVLGMLFLIALTIAIPDVTGDHQQRLAGRGDHARPARLGGGDGPAGRDHVRVLRRRDGDDGDRRAARLRDVARRAASPPTG